MDEIEKLSKKIKLNLLEELFHRKYGHYGGSLSLVNTMAILYGKHLNFDINNLKNPSRDYLVLSKGHAGPVLYATLAAVGIIDRCKLFDLNEGGKGMPSHPDMNTTPGVDMSTGSLGQGISAATGIAYGNYINNYSNYTYVIVGDGELNEGQCWEAIQFAAHRKLDKFILFIDNNQKQLDGKTSEISNAFDFESKMNAFGFYSQTVDGSSIVEVDAAVSNAKKNSGKPSAIVLNTVKGEGVSFIENMEKNHHLRPTDEQHLLIEKEIITLQSYFDSQEEV